MAEEMSIRRFGWVRRFWPGYGLEGSWELGVGVGVRREEVIKRVLNLKLVIDSASWCVRVRVCGRGTHTRGQRGQYLKIGRQRGRACS